MANSDYIRFLDDEKILMEICDTENIMDAWDRVRDKHSSPGVDGITVKEFADNMQRNLMQLQEDLMTGAYQPSPLLRFYVEKGNGESRALNILTVYDRVAQQAVSNVITPILDATFEPCSYGYRKGKSRKQAVEAVIRIRDMGHGYVVSADIYDYFDSVNHKLLAQRLAQIMPGSVVELILKWLKADIYDGKTVEKLAQGLPQGDLLSPLLSNVYLDPFDKIMMERQYNLIRYVDDFLLAERQMEIAQHALHDAEYFLGQLGLRLKIEKTRIVTFQKGFEFLGVLFSGQNTITSKQDTLYLRSPKCINDMNPPLFHKNGNNIYDSPTESEDLDDPEGYYSLAYSGNTYKNASADSLPRWKRPKDVSPIIMNNNGNGKDPEGRAAPSPMSVPIDDEEIEYHGIRSGKGEKPAMDNWIMQQFRAMQDAIHDLRKDMVLQEKTAEDEPDEKAVTRESLNQTLSTSRLLSTLYIQEQGGVLSHSNNRLIVKKGEDKLIDVPAIKIKQILVYGQCSITTPAIDFCLKAGIPVCFLSNHGSYYGRLMPPTAKQVMLQQKQFACIEDRNFALRIAKSFVSGKIHNQRILLQRRQRKLKDPALEAAVQFLADMLVKCEQASNLDELRGYEGTSSAQYFGVFGSLLDSEFSFSKRIKFPPTDPVNAMFSFGYALLFQNVYSLVEAHGLHPYCSYLHALRDGHPALVSDLMEEFRAPVVDSIVIYLINSHIIKSSDFRQDSPTDKCLLTDEARRTYIQHFENKMQSAITHPHTGYVVDYRRCLDLQINELAQCIRGERETYRPMKVRS